MVSTSLMQILEQKITKGFYPIIRASCNCLLFTQICVESFVIKSDNVQKFNKMGFFSLSLVHVLIIALGSGSAGQIMGYGSPAVGPMKKDFELSEIQGTIFNVIAPLLAFIGGPLTKLIIKPLGRRKSAFIVGCVQFLTWFGIFFSEKSFFWLAFLMRAIQGICMGASSGLCSMYIIEISPFEYRGAYGTIHQLFVCLGAVYSYFLGIFCEWKLITILSCIPSGLHVLLIFFVPDSKVTENEGVSETMWQKKYSKQIMHSVIIVLIQQICGINAIITNLNTIFEESNVELKASVSALLVGLSQFISTGIVSPILDKLGRKYTFIISAIGQVIALVLIWADELWTIHSIIPLISLFLDVFMFGLGFGPIPWIVVPELFPDSVRSTASQWASGFNWVVAAIVMFIWPPMSDGIGAGWGFFIFAIISLIGALYGFFFMPETGGQQLGGTNEANDNDNNSNETFDSL